MKTNILSIVGFLLLASGHSSAAEGDEQYELLKQARPLLKRVSELDFNERCATNGHPVPYGNSTRPDEIRCIIDENMIVWRRSVLSEGTTADLIAVGIVDEDGSRVRRMIGSLAVVPELGPTSSRVFLEEDVTAEEARDLINGSRGC